MLPRPFDAKLWTKDPKQAYADLKGRVFNSVKNVVAYVFVTLQLLTCPPNLDVDC